VDIKRAPQKKTKRYFYIAAGVVAVAGLTVGLGSIEPAAPTVERGPLWIDTVKKGEMVRQVRGPGTLVPEQIFYLSAVTAGRIERIHHRPPDKVADTTLLMELSNPDVQLQSLEAQRQLTAAQGQLVSLRTNLQTQRLNQAAVVAQVKAQAQEAERQAEMARTLGKDKLLSPMEQQRLLDAATETKTRLEIEEQRLDLMSKSIEDEISLQAAQVERLRAVARFQENNVQSMKVRAGNAGVLQELPFELGQWVTPGQVLARVAQPGRLKAVLRIPETQAKDVALGQSASIDTRNGIVPGRVFRIAPSSQNGTVTVEVSLEGQLPPGARPDLSVDGTIEIERLEDVLHVGRPAYGQAESTVGLFRVDPDGKSASRVNVKLGRSSVNTIEVVSGLNPGDLVIISDMSAWDSHEKVRLR
jgi:multidrug efflux pump subunit AcrA (membrane-fusion protein)